MFRRLKNRFLIEWYKLLFRLGLKKINDGKIKNSNIFVDRKSLLNGTHPREERERKLFAFLEANKERFQFLFECERNLSKYSIMEQVLNGYDTLTETQFITYLKTKFDRKQVINDKSYKYKEGSKLSKEIQVFLEKDKEIKNKHFDNLIARDEEFNEQMSNITRILETYRTETK
jgi:hypothetical protein